MGQKQREVLVVDSLIAKLFPIIRVFAPGFTDGFIIKKQKGGRM
jgi:hypothetical protein